MSAHGTVPMRTADAVEEPPGAFALESARTLPGIETHNPLNLRLDPNIGQPVPLQALALP